MNEKLLVKGIKTFVEYRKKKISELVDPSQEWNREPEEFPAKFTRMIAKGLNDEVEYFETLLKLAKKKPNDSKKPAKPL